MPLTAVTAAVIPLYHRTATPTLTPAGETKSASGRQIVRVYFSDTTNWCFYDEVPQLLNRKWGPLRMTQNWQWQARMRPASQAL